MGIERIVFPRIFAVEDDSDRVSGTMRGRTRDVVEVMHEIRGCVVAVPAGVGESDPIGQVVVAEEAHRRDATDAPSHVPMIRQRRVERRLFQTCAQHGLARRHPAKTCFTQQLECGVADRALGRPAATGPVAEGVGEYLDCPRHVPASTLDTARVGLVARHRCIGHLLARRFHIDQQRQDRVPPGCHGQFDSTVLL